MDRLTYGLIVLITLLVLSNSCLYFFVAYSQMQESADGPSQIETMLFATAAVSYLPLGIWMIKNRLHSRAPYVIASLLSIALLGLYVVSRTVPLLVVGLQKDIGMIDISAKALQGGIIALSIVLMLKWNKAKIQHSL
ncbi:MAG: hypothetical protein KGH76_02350 [Thaumarchaeota archaeon]|nr:hypothetical protein [Nitrososphaerota archaeon]